MRLLWGRKLFFLLPLGVGLASQRRICDHKLHANRTWSQVPRAQTAATFHLLLLPGPSWSVFPHLSPPLFRRGARTLLQQSRAFLESCVLPASPSLWAARGRVRCPAAASVRLAAVPCLRSCRLATQCRGSHQLRVYLLRFICDGGQSPFTLTPPTYAFSVPLIPLAP